ncbi:phosphonate ABC transporter ATP-binding protein [Burkholderia oklahomensis]|uniref:phosphonate ABC transporter ATP-binding protein n=1 Tax=Burkholderia oklahomensis TaxID=342113 RepID=UPI00016A94BA|nr:phosphonate ABC transporter ATP-binding protein [Burkholderia oklahomensis]AJX35035.1 phosphonate ABC transporter, ATP-binding protein [Burkholderia oklahomensis C6786]AOI48000.1 phosphonate ABC transporter [Burkholderia oklahomensis C6786]KUY50130.1 phosphonate ABC transporter [Burkholderia oklahomensis C6786]MBI0363889.1 phosphonate ABC transporter ATP-binding protein [Burkholderia oklahomensis]SUY28018.1 Phosphate-import ATP-binding protein PhnC [Burkholderia oklahomensis]
MNMPIGTPHVGAIGRAPISFTPVSAMPPRVVAGGETKLAVHGLSMRYPNGHVALRGLDLSVRAGEFVVMLGSNGCGKSTFLKCVVGLNRPTSGTIEVAGRNLAGLSGEMLRVARLPIALISQHANLVKRRSVLANVCTGALGRYRTWETAFGRVPRAEVQPSLGFLDEVGLPHLARQRASTLSGGQAQRVAVARALAQRPQVLLADEPLASLDPEAAEEVMRLLRRLASEDGIAVVCVLHQPGLAQRYADRLIGLRQGAVVFDDAAAAVDPATMTHLYASEPQ